MFLLHAAVVVIVRQLEPVRLDGGKSLQPLPGRALWLLAYAGWLCRRTGGICPGALCRCGPDQNSPWLAGRAGTVSVRYLPHRLHGRRKLPHPAGRYCGGLGLWASGPVCDSQCLHAGAEHVIAIDRLPERLQLAKTQGEATVLDYREVDVNEALKDLTAGRGPGACIDAVGMEAHGTSLDAVYDRAKMAMFLATDRLHALRQAIQTCRKGGTVSIPGMYGGFLDKVPLGAAFAKSLTLKMGQTHVHKYLRPLLARIEQGDIDPAFVITHRLRLDDAPQGYAIFRDKKDNCIKIVLRP